VALGGFARLFCILHAAFLLRLRVAYQSQFTPKQVTAN
jgi:hypothetical protein